MVAMDCVPELAVTKRKMISSSKMAKRLRRLSSHRMWNVSRVREHSQSHPPAAVQPAVKARKAHPRTAPRFVRDNQPPDVSPNSGYDGENGTPAFARSCGKAASFRELLCRIPEETLFQLQQIYEALEEPVGGAGNGHGGIRRKSTSSLPRSTLPTAPFGDHMEDEQSGPDGGSGSVVHTPHRRSKKRARGEEEPATASKAERIEDSSPMQRKKKKARRKSNAT
ncbi:unnamed protein product [Pylaiella littoralis]